MYGYKCEYCDGTVQPLNIEAGFLILLPQPENYVAHMAGLHSEIWEGVDTAKYLKEERESWSLV